MNNRMKRVCTTLLAVLVSLGAAGPGRAQDAARLPVWAAWVKQLNERGYSVSQGSVMLFNDCAQAVAVFNSCFADNPAAPYVIPEPPIDETYVDSKYAAPFSTDGANMIFRLADTDALVTLVVLPPEAAYMGYQS